MRRSGTTRKTVALNGRATPLAMNCARSSTPSDCFWSWWRRVRRWIKPKASWAESLHIWCAIGGNSSMWMENPPVGVVGIRSISKRTKASLIEAFRPSSCSPSSRRPNVGRATRRSLRPTRIWFDWVIRSSRCGPATRRRPTAFCTSSMSWRFGATGTSFATRKTRICAHSTAGDMSGATKWFASNRTPGSITSTVP